MLNHPHAAWLTLYCCMFLLCGYTQVTLCYKAQKTKSLDYFSLLIVAMTIMTLAYAMMVVECATWISYLDEADSVSWKFLASYDTAYSEFLFPVPTMFYCLHNYYLLDKAANEHSSQCARVLRYALVYALFAALLVCVLLASYFLDEY
jgi:hypothetical protein